MKHLTIILVTFLLLSGTVHANDSWHTDELSRMDSPAVAWLEDGVLFVSIANTGGSRERFTIAPADRRSDAFESFSVTVPAHTVWLTSRQAVSNGRPWRDDHPVHDEHPRWRRGDPEDIDIRAISIDSRWQGRYTIPVQTVDAAVAADQFVVWDDHFLDIDVDLGRLLDNGRFDRLVLDDTYMLGTRHRGEVHVVSFEGGFEKSPHRNEVYFAVPQMVLEVTTPRIRDAGLLSFDMVFYDNRRRQDTYPAPLILVVSSDYRVIDDADVFTWRFLR